MSQSTTSSSGHTIHSHHFLIGSPLLVILLFCFAFVVLRPQSSSHVQSIASTRPEVSSDTAQPPLPATLYNGQPDLTKLVTYMPADRSNQSATITPMTNTMSADVTTNPQLSSTTDDNLQATDSSDNQKGKDSNHKDENRLKAQSRLLIRKLVNED